MKRAKYRKIGMAVGRGGAGSNHGWVAMIYFVVYQWFM